MDDEMFERVSKHLSASEVPLMLEESIQMFRPKRILGACIEKIGSDEAVLAPYLAVAVASMNAEATELLATAGAGLHLSGSSHQPSPTILHVACSMAGAALQRPDVVDGSAAGGTAGSEQSDPPAVLSDPRIAARVLALLVDNASDEQLAGAAAAKDPFGRSPLHCLSGSIAAAVARRGPGSGSGYAAPAQGGKEEEEAAAGALRESLVIAAETLGRAAPAAGASRDVAGRTPRGILRGAASSSSTSSADDKLIDRLLAVLDDAIPADEQPASAARSGSAGGMNPTEERKEEGGGVRQGLGPAAGDKGGGLLHPWTRARLTARALHEKTAAMVKEGARGEQEQEGEGKEQGAGLLSTPAGVFRVLAESAGSDAGASALSASDLARGCRGIGIAEDDDIAFLVVSVCLGLAPSLGADGEEPPDDVCERAAIEAEEGGSCKELSREQFEEFARGAAPDVPQSAPGQGHQHGEGPAKQQQQEYVVAGASHGGASDELRSSGAGGDAEPEKEEEQYAVGIAGLGFGDGGAAEGDEGDEDDETATTATERTGASGANGRGSGEGGRRRRSSTTAGDEMVRQVLQGAAAEASGGSGPSLTAAAKAVSPSVGSGRVGAIQFHPSGAGEGERGGGPG